MVRANSHKALCGGPEYATLRDLYSGRRASPRLDTIRALAEHYLVSVEWFTDERQPDPIPMGGVVGLLDPPGGRKGPDREVTIPLAAWEFWRVAEALDAYLESLPPTPDRPIVGDATDDAGFGSTARRLSADLPPARYRRSPAR